MSKLDKEKMQKASSREIERSRVSKRLGEFDYKTCPTYQILIELYGERRSKSELLSLATCLCLKIPVLKLDREAKRRKCVLIKWFHDNFDIIQPHLKYYMFTDEHMKRFIDEPTETSNSSEQ